jgi:hypothetical protein
MGVVFAKTARGQDELVRRSEGLSARVRRVLILIDGSRTVEDVRELVSADDLTHTLGVLEEQGYIELKGVANASAAIVPESGSLPSITAFRELPLKSDQREFEMAQNFMLNTLKTFCGQYGPVSLMSEIYATRSHQDLREYFDRWYHAIVDTRQGRRRAEDLRADLLKVL